MVVLAIMNISAIHQAIRFNKHPKEMEWLTSEKMKYPEGITDLLLLCSSSERMKKFSIKYHITTDTLREILLNFIEKVILKESNTAEALLGLEKDASFDLIRKHYKLLVKIFHPDTNSSSFASIQTSRITIAYNKLKKAQSTHETQFKNITLSRVPPKSFRNASNIAQQHNSSLRNAFIAMSLLAILSLTLIVTQLFSPNTSQLITKNEIAINSINNQVKNTPSFSRTQLKGNLEELATDPVFQDLLRNLETIYENGTVDKIKPILANMPETSNQSDAQLQAKLERLFKITQERKMLLYNFDWLSFSETVKGTGKFLSRYQIIGEEKWKTREGLATITAELVKGELRIISFKLENADIN